MIVQCKITVIVNSYNYAAYVGQAIDSAIAQDYADKEIIVVDDGSTDASPDIIRAYGSAIIPIFNANLGQARSCLAAVRHATGDYILFLDSDDFLLPSALSAVAAVCAPGVAKVQFQLLPVGPAGEVIAPAWPLLVPRSRRDLLAQIERSGTYVTPPNSGNVHRADLFDYITDIDYEASIDGIAYLLAPVLGEVRQIARPLAAYRYHAGNFSGHGALSSDRFVLEARRHQARLGHLAKLVSEHRLPALDVHDPAEHSFVLTREILTKVSGGARPGLARIARYVASLVRERELAGRIARFGAWAFALQLCPDRLRRKLALYRSDPRARDRSRLRFMA